ncbi:MAG TPA: GTPase Era, partial [Pseudomonadales bacterium]|nr:GTPase Era [Pseudomonadales bacterium]
MSEAPKRCGYVAIIGRPNVGKSTLLNHVLGQKISITSRKPQTTRHRVLGVKTEGTVQAIYVDTPGLHKQAGRALNRYMNKAATTATRDVDVILFVVDGMKWTPDDEMALQRLERTSTPVIAVINKVDEIEQKEKLLPYLEQFAQKRDFAEIIPLSALKGNNLPALEAAVEKFLPESDFIFPEDQITDRPQRFIAAEIVREKIMRQLGAEVPYSMTVEIEEFKWEENHWLISALILVE